MSIILVKIRCIFNALYHDQRLQYKGAPKYFYTGCPDQIVRSVNLILLPNQKTYRKCKDSFKIVRKRATKYVFG